MYKNSNIKADFSAIFTHKKICAPDISAEGTYLFTSKVFFEFRIYINRRISLTDIVNNFTVKLLVIVH